MVKIIETSTQSEQLIRRGGGQKKLPSEVEVEVYCCCSGDVSNEKPDFIEERFLK